LILEFLEVPQCLKGGVNMADKILMPKLGLTMTTGTVVKWLKDEGDPVNEKEPVLEIETEKLTYAVECPSKGVLIKKLAAEGGKYPIASVLGYVGTAGEAIPDLPVAGASVKAAAADSRTPSAAIRVPERGKRVFISPVAKKLAASVGIDYRQIAGTGPNGRIVKADVVRFNDSRAAARDTAAWDRPERRDTVVPYTGIRETIGENMSRAWAAIPMVTHHVSAYVGAMLEYRAMLNAGVNDKSEHVSINDLLLKLVAAALARFPKMNSSLTDAGIVIHGRVHLGMATALDNGLVVPVIRDADRKGLLAISRDAKELSSRAKSGGLTPDDFADGTFTVSNLGAYGSVDFFTPIINPPQAGILGIGRIRETPAVVNGNIEARPMIGLSLTYDHRIIDGAVAAEFVKVFMGLLENPARSVL
jgi:pyruvate dehydrogenase E2 component (dihydrolipoamide acetyltransferase)